MNEKLSALLDDELSEHEREALLREMTRDPALRGTWERYHLIRSSLRRELGALAAPDLAGRIARELEAQPPARASLPLRTAFPRPLLKAASALAIAASVAAVAIFTVRPVLSPETATQTASLQSRPAPAQPDAAAAAVASARDSEINAMLVKHSEFSPAVGPGSLAPYVRVVGYSGDQ
jgi:sigma-E factor negative regulatory protein RseA